MKLLATIALVVVPLAQVCTPKTVHDPAGSHVVSAPAAPQPASTPASAQPAPPAPAQQPRQQAESSWPGALPPRDQPTPQPYELPPPAVDR